MKVRYIDRFPRKLFSLYGVTSLLDDASNSVNYKLPKNHGMVQRASGQDSLETDFCGVKDLLENQGVLVRILDLLWTFLSTTFMERSQTSGFYREPTTELGAPILGCFASKHVETRNIRCILWEQQPCLVAYLRLWF